MVVERFHRNKSIPANEDVAERVFMLPQRQIELTYHLMDHRFIPSKTFFTKPKGQFEQAMVSTFQVQTDFTVKIISESEVCEQLWDNTGL